MNWKYLYFVICVFLMADLVSASWLFSPKSPPPMIFNNNTNLSLGSLTMSGDINMNNNSIFNAHWINTTYINVTNITLNDYVPYVGATGDLQMGIHNIVTQELNFSFLISNFVGGIDATGDPWYLAGVGFQVEGGFCNATDCYNVSAFFDWLEDKPNYYNITQIEENFSLFVPYLGATNDVDLGTHNLNVDDLVADDADIDDLWVIDDAKFGNDVDIFDELEVNGTSQFNDDVAITTNDTIVFEVETTDPLKSAEIRLLADGTNDLYIYTYGSYRTGTYYGLPRGNTSLIDARGERLIIGTFDTSPMYLATDRNPRWIITEDGDLIPFDDDDVDIGNVSNRVKDLYLVGEDGDGGLHFVEDDTSMGNLTMDDDFNLLWNGNIISNTNSSWNESYADEKYIPYTGSIKTWNLSGQNITNSDDTIKVWFSGPTLMVGG